MWYFTVGPSQVYPTIPTYLQAAVAEGVMSLSHRSSEFSALYRETQNRLRQLLGIPTDHRIFFLASANEAWERIIQNTVARVSAHYVHDAFGKRFAQIATELDKHPLSFTYSPETCIDLDHITVPTEAELLCFTHNESSTGAMLDIQKIHEVKKAHPDKLIALDAVSSLPYPDIDYTLIDMVYASVQKGFGLPAGMAILIASPAAVAKSQQLLTSGASIGSYHNFMTLAAFDDKGQTPETPNVLGIYLLHQVLGDMCIQGIKSIRTQIDEKALLLSQAIDAHPLLTHTIPTPADRSRTTPVVAVQGGSAKLIEHLARHGYLVGEGYGDQKDTHIRIANFPAHTKDQVLQLIREMEKYSL